MVDPQLERLAKREGDDRFAGVGSVLEIACQCGRSGCAEVIALPWCVYEQAQGSRDDFCLHLATSCRGSDAR